jgi:hypothetical protein
MPCSILKCIFSLKALFLWVKYPCCQITCDYEHLHLKGNCQEILDPVFFFHFSTQFRFLMNGSKSLRIYIWLRIHWDIQYDKKWIFGEQMTPRKPSLQWHLRTTPKLFSRCHCHHGNHWQWSETFLLRQWHRGNRCKRIYFHLFEFEPIKWLWVVILTK